jgi:transcriptional regulator with XRE-family HTH domain
MKNNTDVRTLFAKRLKMLRTKAGLSISGLAKLSGVSRQHVRELELPDAQKRVTITTMKKLADGLNIPMWNLVQFKK